MSYSRRQLYAFGEPLGDGATRREVGGKTVYGSGGGGGGGGGDQKQTTVTDIPEWAKPYAKETLGKTAALTSAPYQTYGGERVAQFTPLQQQAFGQAGQQQVAGQIGQATGIAGLAAQQGLNAGNYQAGSFDPMSVQAPSLQQFQMGPAMGVQGSQLNQYQMGPAMQVGSQQVGTQGIQAAQTGFNPMLERFQMGPAQTVSSRDVGTQGIEAAQTGFRPDLQQFQMEGPQSFTQAGTAEQFMNPYMQNVVGIQQREAQRQADIAGTQRGAEAVRAGAFGGSRQAIMEAEAQRNLSQQMGDIQATGSQAAFQQAQQQFNQEQQARAQAQQANLQARLGVQELGTQAGLQTSLANLSNEQQSRVQSEANRLQSQGMNQEAALRSALANQQAGLTVSQENLRAAMGTQELGTQAGLQTSLANLSNEQQARVQSEANRLQSQGMNQDAALRSALANQQAGLTVGQQNLAAQLGIQQLGAGQDMQAQLANQQAGLTVGQQNLAAQLGIQQLGTGQSMEAQRANQQARLDAQRAFEQSRQFGAELGLRGGAQALQGAQTLGQLGGQQFGQQMDIMGRQADFGGQQRAATQDILSQQYQDFLNQQRAPYDQLSFMNSMFRGTPMGQTTTMYAPPPSTTSQLIGLGTAAAGAYGAYQGAQPRGNAAGGEVKSYAAGGIASLSQPEIAAAADGMSDQQLQQTQGLPSITELARMTLAAEAQQRAQMRQAAAAQQAMMQQQPQTTVAEEQMAALGGISDLPAPNLENLGEGMAGGGIVAFQTGDMVPDPVMVDEERKRAAARLNAGIGAPPQAAAPAPVGSGILGDFTRMGETQMAAEKEATKSEREGIASYKKFLEDREKKAETYGTPTEERLKKREEEAKGSSKQNVFMTMIDVGLRVAAGESPNALSNIAKGAQQGLKGFQERLDTIKTNKEKLDEDYARLYEIRAEKVDAVGERLSTLKREELSFEADAARRAANIAAAVEGKKIEYKVGKEKSADAFRNATAGSQTPERQAYADLLKKNKGDAVAALAEFNQKFGKKELAPGVKAGVEALQKKIAEIAGRVVPLDTDEAQIAKLEERINRLTGDAAPAAGASGGKAITTKAQYDALPKGATYVDPNGVTRTKG
jgi:hypothetical protein